MSAVAVGRINASSAWYRVVSQNTKGLYRPLFNNAAHWDVLAAADFFTVEVWMPRGLTRFTVLVLIELATRRVQVAGITAERDGAWVTHLTRNATDAVVDRRD